MAQLVSVPHWRHVYRSLIRESSYLPDPIARWYMSGYVRGRYRHYMRRAIPNSTHRPFGQINLERRARHLLSIFHRANEGYMKPLERVLMLSYGRLAARRRQLLRPMLEAGTKLRGEEDEEATLPAKNSASSWDVSPTLQALISSQAKQQCVSKAGVKPTIIQPVFKPVPEKNIWGRPHSANRIRAMKRRWFHKVTDSVFPPLPEDDLNILLGLMDGTEPWKKPERRKRPVVDEGPKDALTPEFLIYGPEKGHTFRAFTRGRPHDITRRFMRTLWGKVCDVTPRMTKNEEKDTWIIEWGRPTVKSSIYRTLDPELGLALFEGVDANTGELPKPKKVKREVAPV